MARRTANTVRGVATPCRAAISIAYDPQSGRFLTQDPIGLAGGVNLHAYAGNNPVTFSDPFGLCVKGNSTQSQGITDCEKFAVMVEETAKDSKSTEAFVRALGKTFAGFPEGKLTLAFQPVNKSLDLGGTGFRSEMNDGDGHPWRHGAAFIVAGYDLGQAAATGLAAVWEAPLTRGASGPDVRLGADAAAIGASLANGDLQPSHVAEWIRDWW